MGGLGIACLLVGVLSIFVPDMFGLLPSEYEAVPDNLIHLTLVVLGICSASSSAIAGQPPSAPAAE